MFYTFALLLVATIVVHTIKYKHTFIYNKYIVYMHTQVYLFPFITIAEKTRDDNASFIYHGDHQYANVLSSLYNSNKGELIIVSCLYNIMHLNDNNLI